MQEGQQAAVGLPVATAGATTARHGVHDELQVHQAAGEDKHRVQDVPGQQTTRVVALPAALQVVLGAAGLQTTGAKHHDRRIEN